MGANSYRDLSIELPSNVIPGKAGVVTVTYNSAEMLSDFFDSLDKQTYTDFCLISVDNASSDKTLEMLRTYSGRDHLVIANEVNLGVAAANNQGIRAAIAKECEYVILMNNDVVLDPSLLTHLVRGANDHKVGMTVPLIYFSDQPRRIWTAGGAFHPWLGFSVSHRGEGETDNGQYAIPRQIDYAPTCCVLIRRSVFAEIGLMDERYFVYVDDVDFMFRAKRAGVQMFFIPHARLWHKVNGLTGGSTSDFTYFYNARGRALFLHKHFSQPLLSLWMSLHHLQDGLRALLHKSFRHAREVKRNGMVDGRKTAGRPMGEAAR